MWISQQLLAAQLKRPAADLAQVTGGTAAQGINEYRSLPLAGPWGIAWLPPNAASAVVVTTGAGDACVGTLAEDKGLAPGELLLYSAGGARIYLKQNGDVEINGQIFGKAGA